MSGKSELLGIVLAGGRSKRMGRDKGLLRDAEGKTWTARALAKLALVCGQVAVSINSDQRETYGREFPNVDLIVDSVPVPGPMGALLSVFAARDRDLLVLAADMIDMRVETLRGLLSAGGVGPGASGPDAVLFIDGQRLEPLCGYYFRAGLAKLAAAAGEDRLSGYALQQLPAVINVRTLPLSENMRPRFRNYNSPKDIG